MSLNRVILSGVIGHYGVRIEWTAAGKPQTSFTLVCEEDGKVSTTFRTFIPVLTWFCPPQILQPLEKLIELTPR